MVEGRHFGKLGYKTKLSSLEMKMIEIVFNLLEEEMQVLELSCTEVHLPS